MPVVWLAAWQITKVSGRERADRYAFPAPELSRSGARRSFRYLYQTIQVLLKLASRTTHAVRRSFSNLVRDVYLPRRVAHAVTFNGMSRLLSFRFGLRFLLNGVIFPIGSYHGSSPITRQSSLRFRRLPVCRKYAPSFRFIVW